MTTENIKKLLICIIAIAALIFVFYKVNNYINAKTGKITPVTMTIDDSKDPFKLKTAVNDNSDARLDDYQAKEVSNTITKIIDRNREPDRTVNTVGSNYQSEVSSYAKQQKADAVVVTPAKGETKQVSDIKDTDNVTINQYNIKAYPKHQVSVAHYTDGDTTIDYETQVKIFGAHAYIGPTVKLSKDDGTSVGVKMTIPF